MSDAAASVHTVVAYNSAKESENKIHDDAVARQYGFAGGLVPGVDVYGYMTHAAVARWGRAWLDRGWIAARFLKPVYEGEEVTVRAAPTRDGGLEIEAISRGEVCGQGTARLPEELPALPVPDQFPHRPLPDERPPAAAANLPVGALLGSYDCVQAAGEAAHYLADVRESLPLYAEAGLTHPGFLLRLANWTLRRNVRLGPWIHVASEVQNLRAVEVGTPLSARARITANYERKGHKYVELDVLVVAAGEVPVIRIGHTAIYQPRRTTA